MSVSTTFVRVRYPETDRMGVAYHAHYYVWFEQGRTEFMRERGCAYSDLEENGVYFPVIESGARYHRPALYDELLRIETELVEVGRARVRFAYRLLRDEGSELLAVGHTVHAHVDAARTPRRISESLRAKLLGPAVADRTGRGQGRGLARALVITLAIVLALASGCGGGKKKRPPRLSSAELYQQATSLMEQKKYAKARIILTDIGIREMQDSSLDPLVKLAIADAYLLDGGITNVIEAQARYEQFLSFYPSHEKAAYAQFNIGRCLFEQSAKPSNDQEYTRRAMAEFEKVRAIDPASEYVARAGVMLDQCREKLARHDFNVGRFYLRKGACGAAAGRFVAILKDHAYFSAADATHYYLGQSLLCSNNVEEGKIYLSKLVNDYPESPWAGKARDTLADAPD